jgi:hypothetical protein
MQRFSPAPINPKERQQTLAHWRENEREGEKERDTYAKLNKISLYSELETGSMSRIYGGVALTPSLQRIELSFTSSAELVGKS